MAGQSPDPPSHSAEKIESHENHDSSGKHDSEDSTVKREEKFTFLSLCGLACSTGESWIAVGGSLSLAIYNGGSPGVLYGFIADSACYWVVAASIAELASSMPHTATVYRWAHVTGGRYGDICSWFAGWWSFAAWQLAVASLVSFMALQILGIYSLCHPDFQAHNWTIFVAYACCNWFCCLLVLFGDRWLARVESFGLLFELGGWLISIIVCAVYPHVSGKEYASNKSVWTEWQNETGWSSNGFVFCLGMLNAAFAVCAPDIPAHLAEEIPRAHRNVPLAILAQYVASFATGFCFLITILYANADLRAVTSQQSIFPLSLLYLNATSRSTAVGLLCLCILTTFFGVLGVFVIAGRQCWALARENATPASSFLAQLHPRTQAPFRAIAFVGVLSTCIACLYIATPHAFNAVLGSFVCFLSLAYLAALVPHLLSGRKHVTPGPFHMPWPVGHIVNFLSCGYLIAFGVIFCFPSSRPVTTTNVSYTPVILVGWTVLAALWRVVRRKKVHTDVVPDNR